MRRSPDDIVHPAGIQAGAVDEGAFEVNEQIYGGAVMQRTLWRSFATRGPHIVEN